MRRRKITMGVLALTVAGGIGLSPARADERRSALTPVLRQEFDLGAARSPGTRYFEMVTTFVGIGLDGTRGDTESLRVKL